MFFPSKNANRLVRQVLSLTYKNTMLDWYWFFSAYVLTSLAYKVIWQELVKTKWLLLSVVSHLFQACSHLQLLVCLVTDFDSSLYPYPLGWTGKSLSMYLEEEKGNASDILTAYIPTVLWFTQASCSHLFHSLPAFVLPMPSREWNANTMRFFDELDARE